MLILMKTMTITSRMCSWTGTQLRIWCLPVMGHVFWSLPGLLHHLLKQVADFHLKTKNGVSVSVAAPNHLWWLYWLALWSSSTDMLRILHLFNALQSGLSKVPLPASGTSCKVTINPMYFGSQLTQLTLLFTKRNYIIAKHDWEYSFKSASPIYQISNRMTNSTNSTICHNLY